MVSRRWCIDCPAGSLYILLTHSRGLLAPESFCGKRYRHTQVEDAECFAKSWLSLWTDPLQTDHCHSGLAAAPAGKLVSTAAAVGGSLGWTTVLRMQAFAHTSGSPADQMLLDLQQAAGTFQQHQKQPLVQVQPWSHNGGYVMPSQPPGCQRVHQASSLEVPYGSAYGYVDSKHQALPPPAAAGSFLTYPPAAPSTVTPSTTTKQTTRSAAIDAVASLMGEGFASSGHVRHENRDLGSRDSRQGTRASNSSSASSG